MSAPVTPTEGGSNAAVAAPTAQASGQAVAGIKHGDSKPYVAPATQADLDRIIESRLARERAKYEGFDELKAKATKFDEIEQANLTELQKATARAEKAEAEAEEARLMMLRHEVAAANNLPAVLAARSASLAPSHFLNTTFPNPSKSPGMRKNKNNCATLPRRLYCAGSNPTQPSLGTV